MHFANLSRMKNAIVWGNGSPSGLCIAENCNALDALKWKRRIKIVVVMRWIMKHRIFLKKSVFPASWDVVWEKLQQLATLQYIAKPFASFSPLAEESDFIWEEDRTFQFSFKLFCLIPFGIHTIHVVKFQKTTYEVYTNEQNTNVPVWNHKIVLKKMDDDTTEYTDEVELYAGWKTPFVYLWASLIYAHRQKKWLKLL